MGSTRANLDVRSNPAQAAVTIRDGDGAQVFEGTTPTEATLPKSSGYFRGADYMVTVTKPGFATQSIPVTRTIDGWYWGNLLFGGMIGLVIVDPTTGAMWSLDEDLPLIVLPEEVPAAPDDASGSGARLPVVIDELTARTAAAAPD